jgi:DNA-binding CsgD family transcriptional regulator
VAGELALSTVAAPDFLSFETETSYSPALKGGTLGSGHPGSSTGVALAGRDEEMVSLDALFRGCMQGKGIVAVIRGPIASGKTALLRAFAEQVAAVGAIFLDAAASRVERDLQFGVMDQLFRGSHLPIAISEQLAELIEDCTLAGAWQDPEPEAVNPVLAGVFEGLLKVLAELSEVRPVVIAVDDVHHADIASLHCLSYLARRTSASRILVVLTESTQTVSANRLLHAEILRQGNCSCISLAPLSPSGVTSLLNKHLGSETAKRLALTCREITGGNPLLVNALGEDSRISAEEPDKLLPRSAFRSAVVTCLHRFEPRTVELAQAVAVLGESVTPGLLAELLGITLESAAHGLSALSTAGLMKSGLFRHEAARQAVLEHMTADERAAMHGRAAQTLYKTGATPGILAGHLVDAHRVGARWAVPVLQEAADRALADGEANRAIAYLRRAERECADDRQRAAVRFSLACAEWPINPEGAARHLAELVTDAREGRLDNECMSKLAYYLLWVGDTADAAEILSALDIAHEDTAEGIAGLWAYHVRSPLNFLYPQLVKEARGAVQDTNASSRATARPRPQDTSSPSAAYQADSEAAIIAAERILQEQSLNDPTLASVTTALMALICEDMLDRAASWCDMLMQESIAFGDSVLWRAVLTGFQAIIETRRGNLPAAENYARTALASLTRKAWGVVIGGPLSSLLLTTIASGKHGDAAACLRIPVPDAMFGTPYGLLYLYARGEYYLVTGCPEAALADFTDCGKRMVAWGLDQPGLVPWRTKAAEAYLVMGNNLRARELSREQLEHVGSRSSRTRGISLRALALTSHPTKRTALLRESVEVLRDSGARLELAYTLNELSNAHLACGEHSRAHWAARQARNLAERCGAQALKFTLSKAGLDMPVPDDELGTKLLARLSDAEQRVAMLAACGYTNNQIAHKLFITVSTVEQHLTRVYRKLGVTCRAELPIEI